MSGAEEEKGLAVGSYFIDSDVILENTHIHSPTKLRNKPFIFSPTSLQCVFFSFY